MINGVEHIAICARDTKALTDWYVKMFGFSICYDNGKGTYFVKAADGAMFEIMACTKEETEEDITACGIRHIALSVGKDDFDVEVKKIKDAGMPIVTDVKESASGIKTFFFKDPEGNVIHFIYRPVAL